MSLRFCSRRDVLKAMAAVPVASAVSAVAPARGAQRPGEPGRLALVSRHVQWADIEEGAAVAAEAGFTAIAWTCRPGAHILPENVERDLPRAMAAASRNGLAVPMLITAINTANAPRAEAILGSMRQAGITRYRAPNFRYDYSRDLIPQWEALKPQLAVLAELNEKYGTTAMFHTHSSQGSVGGGLWDLWLLVRDFAPSVLAINYDLGHAFVRGGTEWMQTARFAHRHVAALSVKDVHWVRRKDAAPGTWPWTPEFVPPGQGMVNFRDMFMYFKSAGFNGPIEVYYEYDVPLADGRTMNMLGTNYGTWQLEMPRAQFIAYLKRDLDFYRALLRGIDWPVR
jgi:sugar phosphate isomerase/epimerase